MKKILLRIILVLQIVSCSSQPKEKDENDFYYVINVFGAELYQEPNLNSKILKIIKVGEKITPKEILKTGQSKKIGEGFYLGGNFIKIQTDSHSGYLFSSDLTKIKPQIKDVYDGIFVADIIGKVKNKRIEERIEKFDNKEYEIEDKITEYENGEYIYSTFDGCFDHIYNLKKMSTNEVYHLMTTIYFIINETKSGNEIEIPEFLEKKENELFFTTEGATEDLKIIIHKDGTFTISSYDCT